MILVLEFLFFAGLYCGTDVVLRRWMNRPLVGWPVLLGFTWVLAAGIGLA